MIDAGEWEARMAEINSRSWDDDEALNEAYMRAEERAAAKQ